MSDMLLTLKIEKVGDLEALNALNALDRKGRQIVEGVAGSTGRALGDVAVAYERAGSSMRSTLEEIAKEHEANIRLIQQQEAATAKLGSTGSAGFGRIRQGLTSLVAQLTNTTPVIDRIGGQFLAMGAGGTIAIAATAGLAAIAAGWRTIRADALAAEAAEDAALKKLIEWDKQKHADAGGQFSGDVNAASGAFSRDSTRRSRLATAGNALFGMDVFGAITGGVIDAYLASTKRGFDASRTAVHDGFAAINEEVTRNFVQSRAQDAATLAENIRSNNATHAERLRAARMLKEDLALMQQYKAAGVSGDIRSALGTQIEGLDSALNPEDKAGEKAAREAAAQAKREAAAYQRELTADLKEARKIAVSRMVEDAEVTFEAQNSVLKELVPTKKQIADAIKQASFQIGLAMEHDPVLEFQKSVKRMAEEMKHALSDILGQGLSAGFEAAFSGKGIDGAFKSLTASVLSGLGGFMEALGAQMIVVGIGLEAFATAVKSLNGIAAIAAGVALIAAGAGLKAIAGSFGTNHMAGGAGGSYASGGGLAQIIDRGVINPDSYSSRSASSIQARPSVTNNVTIIGPNDPSAQRAWDELQKKSMQRGSLTPSFA